MENKGWMKHLKNSGKDFARIPETPIVKGYEWNNGIDYHKLFESYATTGFQATNFAMAVKEIQKMIDCRKTPMSARQLDANEKDDFIRRKSNCTIFLGYTSNMVSCGIRETIRFLVEHKMVDCIVTTTGGIEEDFMKCLTPTYLGDFSLVGKTCLHDMLHRIGNLLVPNKNYDLLENWIVPHIDDLLKQQKEKNIIWSPSKIITYLGEKINNPESIYYWAAKNKIPVFCPALTDGYIGDLFFEQSQRSPGFILDTVADVVRLDTMSIKAINSGVIILGGGVIKHHILNANSMRNGANFSVFINTASEFDGSDSGARPDEAVSWAKITEDATPVKIHADATLMFPLLVGETFARDYHMNKSNVK